MQWGDAGRGYDRVVEVGVGGAGGCLEFVVASLVLIVWLRLSGYVCLDWSDLGFTYSPSLMFVIVVL